jgi:hypothetical protein
VKLNTLERIKKTWIAKTNQKNQMRIDRKKIKISVLKLPHQGLWFYCCVLKKVELEIIIAV